MKNKPRLNWKKIRKEFKNWLLQNTEIGSGCFAEDRYEPSAEEVYKVLKSIIKKEMEA